MKKIIMIFVLITSMFLLFGCTAVIFNPIVNEELLIYENEDNTVRLEIAYSISSYGRLYIDHDDVLYDYVVEYFIPQDAMIVYTTPPESSQNQYVLHVAFEHISFFKSSGDKMFLTERSIPTEDFNDSILNGFDETLTRVYDEDIQPLNYFYNTWQSKDNGIYLNNDDLNDYYYHRVQGEFEQESIMITFENGEFSMTSIIDSSVKLSGTYTFDELNMILHPLSIYENYPNEITLIFEAMYA